MVTLPNAFSALVALGVLWRRRCAQSIQPFFRRPASPDRIIAASVLKKGHDVTARRPMFAEEFAAGTRTTQPMTEQHHRRRLLIRRQINPDRNIAIPPGIVGREFTRLRLKLRIHR